MNNQDYQQYYIEWSHWHNWKYNQMNEALKKMCETLDLLANQVELLDQRVQRMAEKIYTKERDDIDVWRRDKEETDTHQD